jgi:hypothetical protein
METVCFLKEKAGVFLISNILIIENKGIDIMLLYLKISGMFIVKAYSCLQNN